MNYELVMPRGFYRKGAKTQSMSPAGGGRGRVFTAEVAEEYMQRAEELLASICFFSVALCAFSVFSAVKF